MRATLFGRDWTQGRSCSAAGRRRQPARRRPAGPPRRGARGRRPGRRGAHRRGLSFTVLPGRGMDLGFAQFNGAPLCWRSPTGEQHAALYEPPRPGLAARLLRRADGHLRPDDRRLAVDRPGRAAAAARARLYLPARNVQVDGEWQGDDYVMWVQGRVRETVVVRRERAADPPRLGAPGREPPLHRRRGREPRPRAGPAHDRLPRQPRLPGARRGQRVRSPRRARSSRSLASAAGLPRARAHARGRRRAGRPRFPPPPGADADGCAPRGAGQPPAARSACTSSSGPTSCPGSGSGSRPARAPT